MEQEPGPRGSPHEPQAPDEGAESPEEETEPDVTAKTDSCLSSSALAQEGQLGDCPARVRYSNRCPQARQANSKSGMPPFY